jgi:erythromycin esterase-like protein
LGTLGFMLPAGFRRRALAVHRAAFAAAVAALVVGTSTAPAQHGNRAKLGNISTRGFVGSGDNVLIGGLIVTGNQPKRVILRAIGPSLTQFGIAGALPNPTLELFKDSQPITSNDNWRTSQQAEIEATNLAPAHELESAIVATLEPNQPYTAIMRGANATTGIGIVEVYDLEPGADSRLGNIATRGQVLTNDGVMIAGTIVVGETGSPQRVLVRALGPSLPVAGTLANPTLQIVDADGVPVRSNDNWRDEQQAEIHGTTLLPGHDLDAAIVETLQSGRYTAIVRGSGASTGVALVEVYALAGSWPVTGDDPTLTTTSDLEPLRSLIGNATVAAFGESYHTSGGFYRMKHRIFRFLVGQMGFRAFAIESKWEGAGLAATYVQGGGGTAQQAISQHINVWQGTEYADLVRWIRDWNISHPNAADKVVLFGFDIQQASQDGQGLRTFLSRIGIPQTDARYTGLSQCEQVDSPGYPFGQIPPERHNACLQTLAAIEQHFTANRADLIGQTSQQDFDIAMLRVVGLRAWENQVFIIASNRPLGYSARDEGMAYAFHAMRRMKAPNARTMIWAANSHVARTSLVTGEVPMGSHLANGLGEDYRSFALTAFNTEIDFPGFGCGPVQRQPDSLEDALAPVLATHGSPAVLVDTRRSSIIAPRVYATGIDQLRPHIEYDGIVHMAHSPKFQPLLWAPCQ